MTMELDTIVCSDALTFVRSLPSESIDCVVTSPPYFGLRDYQVAGQIGLEDTPQAFIARLVELFAEIRRALKKTGVAWVNMGDSFSNERGGGEPYRQTTSGKLMPPQQRAKGDLPSKNLMMIPARLAIALQDSGWILRSECVWVKPNPMPESVTDRPTKAHEMVYLFAKSPRYFFDADSIREPAAYDGRKDTLMKGSTKYKDGDGSTQNPMAARGHERWNLNADGEYARNRRDVFTVATEPTPFAHFATFPQALIEPLILAGCPEKVCAECGKPYVREVERQAVGSYQGKPDGKDGALRNDTAKWAGRIGETITTDKGIHAACNCNAATRAGIVFDPFMGSGTTALVARRLGRHYIGSELNPEYASLAQTRLLHNDKDELKAALSGKPVTTPMFE